MLVQETVACYTHHLRRCPSRNLDARRGVGDVVLTGVDSHESTWSSRSEAMSFMEIRVKNGCEIFVCTSAG